MGLYRAIVQHEWVVQDAGRNKSIFPQYSIVTREKFIPLKKNGEPYKNSKPEPRHAGVQCYDKAMAEGYVFYIIRILTATNRRFWNK